MKVAPATPPISNKEPKASTPVPLASSPHEALFHDLAIALKDRDADEDSSTATYAFMQQISSQISRAQGGHGPFRDRLFDIAVLALTAINSIDRSE